MVELINDYVVDVDAFQYTLKVDLHKTDKEGKALFKTIGYFTTLKGAIQGCINDINKKELGAGTHSLTQAINILNKNNREFKKILMEVIPEQRGE